MPKDDSCDAQTLKADELLSKLDYHGVTLLANEYSRLPKGLEATIAQRKAMAVANEALKIRALGELFNAFSKANNAPAVLFKGTALAYTVYSKPWLRPRSDADIIVDQEHRDEFEQVLLELGYQKHFAIQGDYVSYQSTFSKPLAGESVLAIDLHWRINNRQILAKTYTASDIAAAGKTLTAISPNAYIPNTVDNILIASLHRLGHHQNEERLAWLYDIHLLVQELDQDQWQSLLVKCANKQLAAITLDALQTCEALFNTSIDSESLTVLTQQASRFEPSQIFLQRDLAEWRYFLSDLTALPRIKDKWGFLNETLFPSPAYVRAQMGTQSTLLAYVQRLLRGFRRIL